jgi:sugar lactone lactonase YvrE
MVHGWLKTQVIHGTDGLKMTSPPGVYSFDLKTNVSKPLLNNYRGLRLSGVDDLVVDSHGNILFTDVPFEYVAQVVFV